MSSLIHPTAIIDPGAKLAGDVEVGPYTVIEDNVEIGSGCRIAPHVLVAWGARLGQGVQVHNGAVVGSVPQDLKFGGEKTTLEVGDRTVIREYATLNRGTEDRWRTVVGCDCLLMAYSHVAHDCRVGNHIIMANNAQIAGHVTLGDHVIFSAFCASHQYCAIGPYAFLGRCAKIGQDIPPFVLVTGNPGAPHAINVVGLKREGFARETIKDLRTAYRIIYRQGLLLQDAVTELEQLKLKCPEVALFIDSIRSSNRGIARA